MIDSYRDHCFICLEEEGELISHCNCSLKVHKECCAEYFKNEIVVGKQNGCAICKYEYTYENTKSVRVFSSELSMTCCFLLNIIQCGMTIMFFLRYLDESAILVNAILLYIFMILFVIKWISYKRQTNRFKWWSLKHINICTTIHFANRFSITIKNDVFKKCVQVQKWILYLNLGYVEKVPSV